MKFFSVSLSALLWIFIANNALAVAIQGTVINEETKQPIAGAIVSLGSTQVKSSDTGTFTLEAEGTELRARAIGYSRYIQDMSTKPTNLVIPLKPFSAKGIYLSAYGISSPVLRNPALNIIKNTQINSLVIDVKTDSALVSFKSAVPMAKQIGAQRIILKPDMPELLAKLRSQGIYTIGRIVVFKDTLLAQAHPEWAVKNSKGEPWKDNEGLYWVDPFVKEAWEYQLALAEEAAAMGFDEIQFDYIRFPDTRGLVFSKPSTEASRVEAINGILAATYERIKPYNVFLSADIFGYALWNTNDTDIGQNLKSILTHVDYVCPMLYPSGFQFGIPGFRNPVANSYDIVYRSLAQARERTKVPATRFRPWIQAFKDYAFDRRDFGVDEIQQQINAADTFGDGGYLLWNPRNVYSETALKSTKAGDSSEKRLSQIETPSN